LCYLHELRGGRSEGRFGGRMPSKNLSFPALLGDKVAQQCRKDQIFGGFYAAPAPPPRKSCYLYMHKHSTSARGLHRILTSRE
jgi:hypothetical protein